LLKSLVFLHESWFHCDEVTISFLVSFQFGAFLLQLFLQNLLLILHVGNILRHFSSAFLLLTHYSSDAVFNVSLVASIAYSTHSIQKFNGLLAKLPQVRFSRDGIVKPCSKITDLVSLNFMSLQVRDFCWESESSSFFLFGGFGVRCLNDKSATL
jgi:hypothetical protein